MSWPEAARAVIHMDLDAFYASVEQLRRPELRGLPVIVGGAPTDAGTADVRRGVVSAASYEARHFGVRSAMPLVTALRLCPTAHLVPVDFAAYRSASAAVFDQARLVTDLIEPLSLDEAYLDVTGSRRRFGEPEAIAVGLRDAILAATGLHCSFGVAPSKLVAKVASDLRKPRGLVVVLPGDEAAFLAPLPLRALPGLGPATERALDGLGLRTLGQLTGLPLATLQRRLGVHHGQALWERAQGIDPSSVTVPGRPKSVSREETFSQDLSSGPDLERHLQTLSADVARRLRAGGWHARTVGLKLRLADFTTISRQVSLAHGVDADQAVGAAAVQLFRAAWGGLPVRLLGVGTSGLEQADQLDLLDPESERLSRLDRTLDDLRRRFGDQAISRGHAPVLRDLDWRGDDLRNLVDGESP